MAIGAQTCPHSGQSGSMGSCPGSRSSSRMGPRGCAFSGFHMEAPQALYNAPRGPNAAAQIHAQEHKTMVEMLIPNAPPREATTGLKNADSLVPSAEDVLAAALGAPARRVLMRAEALGPSTGYRDGFLTSKWGFCPPDPSASPIALAACPGRVWSDLCNRMPGLVGRGKIREAILDLPMVMGTPDVIPDQALWAATVCLGILASVYRYEERNNGHEGISMSISPSIARAEEIMQEDECEEELKGLPRVIAIPFRIICTRMGRPLPHLTQYDVSIYNYKLRDHTSVYPYLARAENMDLRWPVFNDRAEAMFLLCMAEVHGCFINGVEIVTRCQERVMERDNEGLLEELVNLKEIIDQLGYVFHKISVNPGSGEQFANPVEWGQRYAKFSAPLSKRVPALSGLALPLFQLMDAFLGRTKYDTFLGLEALHLRSWLPLNHRAFIAAIEQFYQVPKYVAASGDRRLIGVLDGIVESYAGERGFMGTHRYKVYGFLEVVAKTGRTETNGNAGSGDMEGRPWEEVHRTLSESMIERLDPYRSSITLKPHEMRGCFEECRFQAQIISRDFIDEDPDRTTGKVTIDLRNTGMTFGPGDRLAIMPLNPWIEVMKVVHVLGLAERLDERISLEKVEDWKRFSKHVGDVLRNPKRGEFTLLEILRQGHLSPLTKETVMSVHILLRASSTALLEVLASDTWPISGSLGDLLLVARAGVSTSIWEQAFPEDLSWLPKLVPVEVPRTYSISSYSSELLPSFINLTVSRTEHKLCLLLAFDGSQDIVRSGVSSGFLNPHPDDERARIPGAIMGEDGGAYGNEMVLIGISRPLNFQLPISPAAPVAMFAGGSGRAVGRNILFLGVQSRKKFVYEEELREHVRYDGLELYTAFSRDTRGLAYDSATGDLVEKETEPRYLDVVIVEKAGLVCDLVMSTKQGGLGGYLYICGSVSVYETVISGIQKAIYKTRAVTQQSAEALLATAFAERRFMLDIFMTLEQWHRDKAKIWIGVHGSVYDITAFLPIHPGGSLIVAASAGLDASKTFDDLAHTSNPEVMSLLSKYFIGYLAPKPQFHSQELSSLYDNWLEYLRTCVESLTTLSFEVKAIMADSNIWFSGGMLNMGGVRKFYQFQSRLMQNGFLTLFGSKLQELFVKLSFTLVSAHNSGSRLPDVMGMVARAQSSPASSSAQREIAQIGEYVCDSTSAQSLERSIIQYAQAVTELDVRFLEQVREEICTGMDAFELAMSMKGAAAEKQRMFKLAAFLVSILERIAERLETYYAELAAQSLYHPEIEDNPARARWNFIKRRIRDGSFFLYTQDISFESEHERFDADADLPETYKPRARKARESIGFGQIISQANEMIKQSFDAQLQQQLSNGSRFQGGRLDDINEMVAAPPRRLADAHSRRAEDSGRGGSSYEKHLERKAAHRMSSFLSGNLKAIRRLSRAALDTTALEHAMATYGGARPAAPAPLSKSNGVAMSDTVSPRSRSRGPSLSSQMSSPTEHRARNTKQGPTASRSDTFDPAFRVEMSRELVDRGRQLQMQPLPPLPPPQSHIRAGSELSEREYAIRNAADRARGRETEKSMQSSAGVRSASRESRASSATRSNISPPSSARGPMMLPGSPRDSVALSRRNTNATATRKQSVSSSASGGTEGDAMARALEALRAKGRIGMGSF
ncbi:hypothetical protein BDZ91DRAFT_716758 [Kalaharituber pfeilii]|nr:hypothetical protein BDZ91DRAFT_716758 [Kalaharituber pfeilii]